MDTLPVLFASARVIGWALLHFFWQATLVGLIYAAVRMFLPRGEARYRFGMAMLVVLALCPLLTAWRLLDAAPSVIQTATHAVASSIITDGASVEHAWAWGAWLDAVLPWLVLAWSGGVLLLSLRAWRQWQRLKLLVRMAELLPVWQDRVTAMASRFGLHRRVTVLCSQIIATPALVGWIRPVILLPMAVACNFPANQIELILAHELAHLRRWDPLANLLQVVLETLYFHHPVVHWISGDVRNEREICCDELALSISGGSRHAFVTALAQLGELREQHGSLLLAANGGVLLDRVQHMVVPMQDAARARTSARFVAVLLGAALLLFTLRIEWKQAAMQQSLTESIMQLQPALTPPWLALAASQITWHLPDLTPVHAVVARPRFAMPAVTATSEPPPLRVDAEPTVATPVSLRVSDLAPVRQPSMRMVGAVTPSAAVAAVAPTPIRIRQPIYPRNALLRGIEGQVVVEFGLAADGSVQDMRVIHAEPAGVFDQSATQAMRSWRYALPAGVSTQRYRQKMAFMLNAATTVNTSSDTYGGDEIHAKAGCQIVTGTHICRWPDDVDPRVTVADRIFRQ
jgi:TonB family protein